MSDYEREDLLNPLERFSRIQLRRICFLLGLSHDFATEKGVVEISIDLIDEFEKRADKPEQGRNYLAEELIKRGILRTAGQRLVIGDSIATSLPATAAKEKESASSLTVELLRERVLDRLGRKDVQAWCYNMASTEPLLGYDYTGLEANVTNVLYQASHLNKKQWRMLIEQLHKTKPDIFKEDELAIWRQWADEQDKHE